jgi:hypothetical protein
MKKMYSLYDVCQCNHEYLQHGPKCSAIVPVGKPSYRGWVAPEVKSEKCKCEKFKLSLENSARISPSEER